MEIFDPYFIIATIFFLLLGGKELFYNPWDEEDEEDEEE